MKKVGKVVLKAILKLVKWLLFTLLMVSLVLFFLLAPFPQMQHVKERLTFIYESVSTPTTSLNVITGEEGVNKQVVDAIFDLWNDKVPDNIKKRLIDNGWKIVVTQNNIGPVDSNNLDKENIGYTESLSLPVTKKFMKYSGRIYICDDIKKAEKALFHEIGHAIDASDNYVTQSLQWITIYESEKETYKKIDENFIRLDDRDYLTSNLTEYFAAIFNDILTIGEPIREFVPASYDFVNSYISK